MNLQSYVALCNSAKETLKVREQKQVDHEELRRFLESNTTERDRTLSTGKSPGFSGFFKDKINDFKVCEYLTKGVDPEQARQARLSKVTSKIEYVVFN